MTVLAACLVVSVLALVVTSAGLFTPVGYRGSSLMSAAVAGVGLGAAVAVAAVAAFAVRGAFAAAGGVLIVLAGAAWWPVTRRWGALGRLCWASAVLSGACYLVYVLAWTFRAQLGVVGTGGGLVLWTLELAAYLLGLTYLWEMVDILATSPALRRPAPVTSTTDSPFVSLHVPAHNEPPEMVIETLESLLALDYPAYEVLVIDNNTEDPALWRPVEQFCARHADVLRFHHLENWPGFKSGALNYALTVTDPRASVIGVIDADYLADPHYLRDCAPLFAADERLGFVQTPQDYREWGQAAYYRRLYYSYAYFFAVSQVSRDQHGGPIFGGTMGLIRRRALAEVGGWDEWCITEDAELSLRLLRAGWAGRHIEHSYGRGIMPLTFDALQRQRFRWCFGGIQLLRLHWRSLMPWTRDPANRLTQAQRWSYLSGGLQWYGDLLGLVFSAMLGIGVINLAVGSGIVFRRLSGLLLIAVPALTLLSITRAVALLRRTTGASRRDSLGAFGIWLALSWTVALASVRGLIAPAGVFLRTPKTRGDATVHDAVTANPVQATLAVVLAALTVTDLTLVPGKVRWMLAALLLIPLAGALAAPANTIAAVRAELSDELRRRRRTERARTWAIGPLRRTSILTGWITALAAAVVAGVLLLAPNVSPDPIPNVLSEAKDKPPTPPSPAPARQQARPAPQPTPPQ